MGLFKDNNNKGKHQRLHKQRRNNHQRGSSLKVAVLGATFDVFYKKVQSFQKSPLL